MTLSTITFDSNDYKAYASVTEADKILAPDPVRSAAWDALTTAKKGQYLIAATNRLDILSWQGDRAGGSSQDNAWPRKGLSYPDGTAIAEDAIPSDLERAVSLLAATIASTPESADHGSSASPISSVKAGSVQVNYFRRMQTVSGRPLQDETVYALVRKWIVGTGDGSSFDGSTTVSGTDGNSVFKTAGRWGVTRGW